MSEASYDAGNKAAIELRDAAISAVSQMSVSEITGTAFIQSVMAQGAADGLLLLLLKKDLVTREEAERALRDGYARLKRALFTEQRVKPATQMPTDRPRGVN